MDVRGKSELFQWLDSVHRTEKVINGGVRATCAALAHTHGWGINEFQVALATSNKQLRNQLSSVEYAALLRSWRRDFGSPASSPRVRQLSERDKEAAPGTPRLASKTMGVSRHMPPDIDALLPQTDCSRPPPAYRRGHLGVGRQPTTYPEHDDASQEHLFMRTSSGGEGSSVYLSNGGYSEHSPDTTMSRQYDQQGSTPRGGYARSHSAASLSSSRAASALDGRGGCGDNGGFGGYGGSRLGANGGRSAPSGGQRHLRRAPSVDTMSDATAMAGDLQRRQIPVDSRIGSKTSQAERLETRPYGTQVVVRSAPQISEELDEVCGNMGVKIEQRFQTVRDCVRFIDLDRSGRLTRNKLHNFFRTFHQSKRAADDLFDHLAKENGTDEPSCDSFVSLMWHYVHPQAQMPPASRRESAAKASQQVQETLKIFGEKVATRFKNARETFRFVDLDSSGGLSRSELQTAFRVLNLSSKSADAVYDFWNPQALGEVAFTTFAQLMAPYLRAGHEEIDHDRVERKIVKDPRLTNVDYEVRELLHQIGKKAHEKWPSLRDCFRSVDQDKNGRLSPEEVIKFFNRLGCGTDDCERMFVALDLDHNGVLDFQEFKACLGPYIQPGYDSAAFAPRKKNTERVFPETYVVRPAELREMCNKHGKALDKDRRNELRTLCQAVGDKATQRFRQPRDALRLLEPFRGRKMKSRDLQDYFIKVYLSAEMGRRLFDVLDTDSTGQVSWTMVMNTLGPHVLPGYRPLTPDE